MLIMKLKSETTVKYSDSLPLLFTTTSFYWSLEMSQQPRVPLLLLLNPQSHSVLESYKLFFGVASHLYSKLQALHCFNSSTYHPLSMLYSRS